jgi:hypothetical protein
MKSIIAFLMYSFKIAFFFVYCTSDARSIKIILESANEFLSFICQYLLVFVSNFDLSFALQFVDPGTWF